MPFAPLVANPCLMKPGLQHVARLTDCGRVELALTECQRQTTLESFRQVFFVQYAVRPGTGPTSGAHSTFVNSVDHTVNTLRYWRIPHGETFLAQAPRFH